MMKFSAVLFCILLIVVTMFTGCDVLKSLAPIPDETANPKPTDKQITPTPLPELGELTAIDAVYCLQSESDAHELEFNILRFFSSGVVMMVNVKDYKSCSETWDYIKPYLIDSATDIYSHGEYQHSDGQIRFTLSPPGSEEVSGRASGVIQENELILTIQGTKKVYTRVYKGE